MSVWCVCVIQLVNDLWIWDWCESFFSHGDMLFQVELITSYVLFIDVIRCRRSIEFDITIKWWIIAIIHFWITDNVGVSKRVEPSFKIDDLVLEPYFFWKIEETNEDLEMLWICSSVRIFHHLTGPKAFETMFLSEVERWKEIAEPAWELIQTR